MYGIADREAELLTASAISNVFSPLNRFVDNAVKSLLFPIAIDQYSSIDTRSYANIPGKAGCLLVKSPLVLVCREQGGAAINIYVN